MLLIDKLCYYSKLRYINAGEKFLYSIITIAACIISRSLIIALLVFTVNTVLTVAIAGISKKRYRNLMLIPVAFLILSTLAVIVNLSRTPMDAFAIPVGNFYITGSFSSVFFGIQLMATALAAVSSLYFLSLNTPMPDILMVLSKLHCPAMISELMLLIYRFIFVLLEAAVSIMISQKSRLGYKDYKTSLKSFGSMISVLFIRAMKRSNALYDAMESRCYDGAIHVLNETSKPNKKEITAIVFFTAVLAVLTILKKSELIW
ncbi:Energy-coupling factor transporter transmembrane protein CbiQ [uncultured Roseburia sp.]|uniref:Cobalt ECF transporter T component CbiQ n=1 Tax=Brotonthovivens ammoniilytica TaxID=2981725 RepID=A0ABT2TM93_9FIRM|nr:cobalt ECF transporter T component CbiQ [Brotonthovivens ammoniilytica]MCU6763335.1 cobalt ECF transporter T component CbiQ [Brotonthovivens ammoniilytica]SCJ13932.1 Energy-coupling factor transporter transmembrane protein CbiQ [uncultured Roseburia sp.]